MFGDSAERLCASRILGNIYTLVVIAVDVYMACPDSLQSINQHSPDSIDRGLLLGLGPASGEGRVDGVPGDSGKSLGDCGYLGDLAGFVVGVPPLLSSIMTEMSRVEAFTSVIAWRGFTVPVFDKLF